MVRVCLSMGGVPTWEGVPTLDLGVPTLDGRYLPWTWGTYTLGVTPH